LRAQVLSPIEVLQSATSINARILRREGQLGVLARGAVADLIVIDGDPSQDLALLTDNGAHIPVVMKEGRFFRNRLP